MVKKSVDLQDPARLLLKDATKLIIKEPSPMPEGTHLKSHFLGQPYFEKGEKWPVAKNRKKLVFVFQIFNDGNVVLPENIKLIQFYCDLDSDDFPFDTDGGGWLVKIYENLHTENAVVIKKPAGRDTGYYCEIAYESIKTIPDDNDIDDYCKALNISYVLDKDTSWDDLAVEQEFCSQLGGYPRWIQDSEMKVNDTMTLLFQLDSEENAGLSWVDVGMVYAFYDSESRDVKIILQYC
jgi:uncharacterized protein YwqG